MNWDAIGSIGEVTGSIGVLITLIYFGVQLRKSETAMLNSATSAMQVARINSNDQRLEHIELIQKANAGEELLEVERARLQLVFQSEYQTMLFSFMNQRRMGNSGAVQARNFARFLCDNPAFEYIWFDTSEQIKRDFRGLPNPMLDDWFEMVGNQLSEVKSNRSG